MTGNLRGMPPLIDMGTPHPARMHDYWLSGGHNTAADRALAAEIMRVMPGIEDVARLNQAFLRRAVLHMVESGVNQFLDLGSGVPMIGDLHRVVHRADPEARMVYVDSDPVAIALADQLLTGTDRSAVLQANPLHVDEILTADLTRALLDITRPVCLLAPMLHFIPDSGDPAGMLASYRDRLVPGSGLVLLHVTTDADPPGLTEAIEIYETTKFRVHPRTRAQVARMCEGFDLVEPGLVGYADWRPQGPADVSTNSAINTTLYGAVGRKP